MPSQFPLELVSNFLSVILLLGLFYKYLQYKKKLDVIKGLDKLKDEKKVTREDYEFIRNNEREYKDKLAKTEANIKIAQPVFIIIAGILILSFEFQEAMIHLNVVVVAFIFMQVDKIHKRNMYSFLNELRKGTKDQIEPQED
ncbi:hypothetical protein [Arcobacter roscoffensis]|uniref:Uncharacterized protein n=1 Tax=Arcobacter roscoffensis TaxID=2961520 RepID=A0ABY5E2Q7_9BACT|nr:hypothetical protein [Arcobacter roscoffensis]UTJ06467.1 hypothetical protein NJU99_14675 [Arcobacter roscoffensis]